jgi:hypothetical protein
MITIRKIIIFYAFALSLISCTNNPCEDIVCGDYGTCNDGLCECNTGYFLNSNGICVDSCSVIVCGDHGTCFQSVCICELGYEKDAQGLCNTEIRTKFQGTWTVVDNCSQSGIASYTVSVTASTANIFEVKFTNFWGTFVNQTKATVDVNTISIARQQPDNDNYFISGAGTINAVANSITWNYNISDETGTSPQVNVCTATWTK